MLNIPKTGGIRTDSRTVAEQLELECGPRLRNRSPGPPTIRTRREGGAEGEGGEVRWAAPNNRQLNVAQVSIQRPGLLKMPDSVLSSLRGSDDKPMVPAPGQGSPAPWSLSNPPRLFPARDFQRAGAVPVFRMAWGLLSRPKPLPRPCLTRWSASSGSSRGDWAREDGNQQTHYLQAPCPVSWMFRGYGQLLSHRLGAVVTVRGLTSWRGRWGILLVRRNRSHWQMPR